MDEKPVVTMVVTDLDGTLLNSDKKVTPATRQMMKELKNRGILFGIASGRPVESGKVLMHDWGLASDISFLIGMNGGALYDVRRDTTESWYALAGEKILEIIDHFKDLPVIFQAMVGNKRYTSKSTPETRAHARLYGEIEYETDLASWLPGRSISKLIIMMDPEMMPAVRERAASFSDPAYTSMQTDARLYEYMDPRINKGFGVMKACEHFGIDPSHVVAFGDAENDKAMLEFVGMGVCMANGDPITKAAADVVSPYTNDEDAAAVYVMETVLPNNEARLERNANAKVG